MDKELKNTSDPKLAKPIRLQNAPETPLSANFKICEISANTLYFNIKRPTNEFFQTSLYEIDRIIKEVSTAKPEDQETLQLIREKLPGSYYLFRDVFLKSELNRLLPYCSYDHKI